MIRSLTLLLAVLTVFTAGGSVVAGAPQGQNNKMQPDTMPPARGLRTGDAFTGGVFEKFIGYYERGIDEKVYVQTDKPYYIAGDTLWFKAWVVNGITLIPSPFSKYVYVELIDRLDSVLVRRKIMEDSTGFHNMIKLPAALPAGEYCLRAYTQWMRNCDAAFFFHKLFAVGNPVDDSVDVSVEYVREGDSDFAVMTLRGGTMLPLAGSRVRYTVNAWGKPRSGNVKSDDDGRIRVPFTPPADTVRGEIVLDISAGSSVVKRAVALPLFSEDIDLQFFPEGGSLLHDRMQQVAFKAVGVDGLSREVAGVVVDDNGSHIADISTQHLGMGVFSFSPDASVDYYAEIMAGGAKKRYRLPKAADRGCVLSVTLWRGKAHCRIVATEGYPVGDLALVAHSRGRIFLATDNIPAGGMVTLPVGELPSGIVELVLVDKPTGRPVSRRLCFIQSRDRAAASIIADRPEYGKRNRIVLDIVVTGSDGQPAGGDFAVSVTDNKVVHPDPWAGNLVSFLLMSSDLKGYIERPGSYFSGDAPQDAYNLNLLMLTQGWGRFDVGDIIAGVLPVRKFVHEDCQTISGAITNFFGKAARDPYIMVFCNRLGIVERYQLEGDHRFRLTGLQFCDSTSFVLQAMSRGGNVRTMTLSVDRETFPPSRDLVPRRSVAVQRMAVLPEGFLNQSKERYYYEGGMRVVDMDAVSVTARRRESAGDIVDRIPTSYTLGPDRLKEIAGQDIYQAMLRLPGVRVVGTEIFVHNNPAPALVYIDGLPVEQEYLMSCNLNDVESVSLVKGTEAFIFGPGAMNGLIWIKLKTGAQLLPADSPPSVALVKPLGYAKPETFYQPRYEVSEALRRRTPDLRTTIYWDPSVRTGSTGRARVAFYAADPETVYDVALEGVTSQGEVCRAVTTVKRGGHAR